MIHASRRKILSLFAAAPAALPVAVKEIAAKAGIGSVTDLAPVHAASAMAPDYAVGAGPDGMGWDGNIRWLKHRLSAVNTEHQRYHRRRRAEELAHRLNPNLASLRSVSPAAAYRIEVERRMKDLEEDDRKSANLELLEALRQKAMGNP